MKYFKKLSLIISISGALTATSYAAEESTAKLLRLSIGPSDLFLKDVPQLSLFNGSLVEDEKSVELEIDKVAYLNFITNYREVQTAGGYYRELRNFRDVTAVINIKNVDGTITKKSFSLAPDAPNKVVIEFTKFLLNIDAEVTGTVDYYKCFNAQTCVADGSGVQTLRTDRDGYHSEHNFRLLVDCYANGYFIKVEGGIDHPEIQQITFARTIAQNFLKVNYLAPITAISKPVLTGAEFKGFTANIGEFGLLYGQQELGTTLIVSRKDDKLLVETRFPNGGSRSYSELGGCRNHP